MSDYYQRMAAVHLDGSHIFKTDADERSEIDVSTAIEQAWNCSLGSFGKLAPLDWYAVRDGRLVGILELKTRTHESGRFRTVFLNVRKYLALLLGSVGLGVPAIFVVKFTDGVKWIPLNEIDGTSNSIAGCYRIVKSRNDIEPVIEVAVDKMRPLHNKMGEQEQDLHED